MVENRPETQQLTPDIAPIFTLDSLLPEEVLHASESERLTAKLELIMRDPDLNFSLSGYLTGLIIPGMVGNGTISLEQSHKIKKASDETWDKEFDKLPPEEKIKANLAGEHEIWAENQGRRKISDFARL